MAGSKNRVTTVEQVGARLEEWRRSRQKGAAIPDELWAAASELARSRFVPARPTISCRLHSYARGFPRPTPEQLLMFPGLRMACAPGLGARRD